MYIYLDDKIEQYDEKAVALLLSKLPDWRREQAQNFRFLAGQRECAIAYLLLCKGLEENFNISSQPHFVIGEHGKPSLLEFPEIHFNISHCKNAVLCTLSQHAVGADVEQVRPFKEELARYTMNEEELRQINSCAEPAVRFTELWTAKEAVVKLSGRGLQDNIPDILKNAHSKGIRIDTHTFPEKGYAYSIATHE